MTPLASREQRSWRPLVQDADQRAKYLQIAGEVLDALVVQPASVVTSAVECDVAIAAAYLGHDEQVTARVSTAVDGLAASSMRSLGLFGGVAQVGWTLAHLVSETEASEPCEALDAIILSSIGSGTSWRQHDLVSGTAGFVVYAIERAMMGEAGLAARLVDVIESTARPRGQGIAWLTAAEVVPEIQRHLAPLGYWNLGLSHGAPGMIGVLARLVNLDIEPVRTKGLLHGAVTALLDAEPRRGPDRVGRFPSWHATDVVRPALHPHRVAWCYGDLGVSLAVLAASRAMSRGDWREDAIELALACARCPPTDTGVHDPGLCHGAAGVAHLFNRIGHATENDELLAAARWWFEHLLAMRGRGGIGGFSALTVDNGVPLHAPDPTFLLGAAGISLAIHAACTDVEPAWDRRLLADL